MERSKTRPITIVVRPEVAAFAELMERKLLANDHKPHWRDNTPEWLLGRLDEEVEELRQAIFWDKDPQHIAEEAADVANFANFIADVVGGLEVQLVIDIEEPNNVIKLNKNMPATWDEDQEPRWKCPACKGRSILYYFRFCPTCGRRIEWVDFGLDGPRWIEESRPIDPFAAEVTGPGKSIFLLWVAENIDKWKRQKRIKPGRLMTKDDQAEFRAWLGQQVLGGGDQ